MNFIKQLFDRRIRGFRLVEVLAGGCLIMLVLGVYLSKDAAGRESASITSIDRDILDEQRRVRLLKAELAHLETPERIEALSTRYLALAPVSAKRETQPDNLPEVVRLTRGEPAPEPGAAPR